MIFIDLMILDPRYYVKLPFIVTGSAHLEWRRNPVCFGGRIVASKVIGSTSAKWKFKVAGNTVACLAWG